MNLRARHVFAASCVLASLSLAIACSSDDPVVSSGGTPANALEKDTGVRWVIENDPNTNTARLAFPMDPTPSITSGGSDVPGAVSAFLLRYPEIFGIKSAGDLELREQVTEAGVTHVSFVQKANGVAVSFARIDVHLNADGSVDHVSGPFYPDLPRVAAQTPAIDAQTAFARVQRALGNATVTADGAASVAPGLDRTTFALRLEYTVPVLVDRRPRLAQVDAMTGVFAGSIDRYPTLRASGQGVDGKRWNFEIDPVPSGQPYAMKLSKQGNRAGVTVRAATPTLSEDPDYAALPIVSSPNLEEWEADAPEGGKGSAVDVMAKLQLVDAWFRAKVGRLSWDNRGGDVVAAVYAADDGNFWPYTGLNGVWLGNGAMAYTVNRGGNGDIDKPFTDLDTVAHELMHGITGDTSQLFYGGEPGALNESLSDIFGQLVEHDYLPNADPGKIGDEFDDVIRSAASPGDYGDAAHVDDIPGILARFTPEQDDNGGVHILSGIPNLAWYLSTFGGSHPNTGVVVRGEALGWEKSRELWWTLARHELSAFSSFRDAAKKSLLIGRYRGLPRQIIGCAWQAVGVLSAEELQNNYRITCDGADGGADGGSLCQGRRGDVSFCHPTQANAAVVCKDEAYIQITLCPGAEEHGDASVPTAQRCVGTDGVTDENEAKIRCEAIETCDGRADGWYCSALEGYEYAAFQCSGGSRSGGQFCADEARCLGFDGSGAIRCERSDASSP